MDAVSFGDVIQVQMKGDKGFVKFEDESQAEQKLMDAVSSLRQ